MKPCKVEGCDKSPPKGRRVCSMHRNRRFRHGSYSTVLRVRLADVSYAAVHGRLKFLRGDASDFPCVTCGNQAQEWAYQAEERKLQPYAFSEDLTQYAPMCRVCHRAFDRVC